MNKEYAVIDLKSFYASCECARRGVDIFETPLAVADLERSENSVVMSVTPYLKKHYGCPNVCRIRDLPKLDNLIYATPNMSYYLEMSAKVVAIFLEFVSCEDLHIYSIDESFLYLTPYLKMNNCSAEELAAKITKKIKEKLGLLATVGIGPNMFLAKACLDNEGKKYPPYIARWNYEDVKEKLWKIAPLTKIWGIGEATSNHLARLGIRNLEQLAKADDYLLQKEFGIMGEQLRMLANGIDETDIEKKYVPMERNLSLGQLLPKAVNKEDGLVILREMNDDLYTRLRGEHCLARNVQVCICQSGNTGFSRSVSLWAPRDDNDTFFEAVKSIYVKFIDQEKLVKRLSISFGGLLDKTAVQLSLFENQEDYQKKESVTLAMDNIARLYGRNACLRGISYLECSTAKIRHSLIGGHKA